MSEDSLGILSRILNEFKSSDLLTVPLIKDLYQEAKNHESNLNSSSLLKKNATETKAKLQKDTNFYLILIKMLCELKYCKDDSSLRKDLNKIHTWYVKNRQSKSAAIKNDKRSTHSVIEQMRKPITAHSSLQTEETLKKSSSCMERINTEQLHAKRDIKSSTTVKTLNFTSSSTSSLNMDDAKESENDSDRLKNETNNKDRDNITDGTMALTNLQNPYVDYNKIELARANAKSVMSSKKSARSIDSSQKGFRTQIRQPTAISDITTRSTSVKVKSAKIVEKVESYDENMRKNIIKALSIYADQLYNQADVTNTNLLEKQLKSIEKFYNALSSKESESYKENGKVNLTLSDLVDVAKPVSDQMVLTKTRLPKRVSNSLNDDNFELYGPLNTPLTASKNYEIQSSRSQTAKSDNISYSHDNVPLPLPIYAIEIKRTKKRPQTSSYVDWRGQIAKPQLAIRNKRLNSLLSSARLQRPKTTPTIMSKRVNVFEEDVEPRVAEFDREKIRKYRNALRTMTPRSTTSKDARYMNFVKPATESTEFTNTPRGSFKTAKTNSEAQLVHQVSIEENYLDHKCDDSADEECILCECSSYYREDTRVKSGKEKPGVENLNIKEALSSTSKRSIKKVTVNESMNSISRVCEDSNLLPMNSVTDLNAIETNKNEPNLVDKQNQDELRNFLIQAFDPKFASKIGIKDFKPSELLNQTNTLEFIPFEKIEKKYPKQQGAPSFQPKKPIKQTIRTKPTIPRPEVKDCGNQATIYEQIIELKRQVLDKNDITVWQPDDANLVKDLLEIQHEPIMQTLQVHSINNQSGSAGSQKAAVHVNRNVTPMGRPVNIQPMKKWKDDTVEDSNKLVPIDHYWKAYEQNKTYEESQENLVNPNTIANQQIIVPDNILEESEGDYQQAPEMKVVVKSVSFKISGTPLLTRPSSGHMSQQGRPIPTEKSVEDPVKSQDAVEVYNEAKNSVNIPNIFKGSIVRNYAKELSAEERLIKENKIKAAILIQTNYRKHLARKRSIQTRSILTPEKVEWEKNYRMQIEERRKKKQQSLKLERQRIEKENEKLKESVSQVGMHVDIYKFLAPKQPIYSVDTLTKAVLCIQRWYRGYYIRKRLVGLKKTLDRMGQSWQAFTKRYRTTVRRMQRIRGMNEVFFEFEIDEALDFVKKEKKYTSIFEHLAYGSQLEHTDLEKMFNYCDLFPTHEELHEAKTAILKTYKSTNTQALTKNMVFEMIYYIYPPLASKLKSTRKSMWLNPRINGDDALRLNGSKTVEKTSFEKCWQLVADRAVEDRMEKRVESPRTLARKKVNEELKAIR